MSSTLTGSAVGAAARRSVAPMTWPDGRRRGEDNALGPWTSVAAASALTPGVRPSRHHDDKGRVQKAAAARGPRRRAEGAIDVGSMSFRAGEDGKVMAQPLGHAHEAARSTRRRAREHTGRGPCSRSCGEPLSDSEPKIEARPRLGGGHQVARPLIVGGHRTCPAMLGARAPSSSTPASRRRRRSARAALMPRADAGPAPRSPRPRGWSR